MRPNWKSPNAVYYRINGIKDERKADKASEDLYQTREMLREIVEKETGLSVHRLSVIWKGVHDEDIAILISLGILDPKREYLNPKHAERLKEVLATDETAKRMLMKTFCPSTSNFMRDDIGTKVLEAAREAGGSSILSAACGNGAETYTIAIALAEAKKRAKLVAIDINPHAIERSREGVYSFGEPGVDIIPEPIMQKYFKRVGYEIGVKERIRRKPKFYVANLMQPLREQGIEGSFDVICLRNVIKYLTEEGRERALTTTSNVLQRRGILILGSEKHEGKSVLKEIEQFGFSKSRWYTPECPMYVRA